jgi:hypothetical protein
MRKETYTIDEFQKELMIATLNAYKEIAIDAMEIPDYNIFYEALKRMHGVYTDWRFVHYDPSNKK